MPAVMGVDPGVRGGLAILDAEGKMYKYAAFDPEYDEIYLSDLMRHSVDALFILGGSRCYFEKVGYFPTDGGQGAFTFGNINGFLRGALRVLKVDIRDVRPMMWQISMDCLSGGNKNITKRKAQELFPEVKITHRIADALLIAKFGWKKVNENGTPNK